MSLIALDLIAQLTKCWVDCRCGGDCFYEKPSASLSAPSRATMVATVPQPVVVRESTFYEEMKEIHARGGRFEPSHAEYAAKHGFSECLQYLLRVKCPLPSYLVYDDLTCMKMLYAAGCRQWCPDIIYNCLNRKNMECLDFALTHKCPYDIDKLVSDMNWIWDGYYCYIVEIDYNTLLQYDTVCELFVKMYQTGKLQRPFAVQFARKYAPKRRELLVKYAKLECSVLPDDIVDYIITDYL